MSLNKTFIRLLLSITLVITLTMKSHWLCALTKTYLRLLRIRPSHGRFKFPYRFHVCTSPSA